MNQFVFNQYLCCAIVGLSLLGNPILAISATPGSSTLPIFSTRYDSTRDPIEDGKAALKIALDKNRKVLIEVGGNWCSWCAILDKFIHSRPQLKKDFFNTFVLLKVNVSDENDNKEFLKVFPPVFGYPHMFVTNSKGKILESKDTADFLVNKRYSVAKLYAFINQWKAE